MLAFQHARPSTRHSLPSVLIGHDFWGNFDEEGQWATQQPALWHWIQARPMTQRLPPVPSRPPVTQAGPLPAAGAIDFPYSSEVTAPFPRPCGGVQGRLFLLM